MFVAGRGGRESPLPLMRDASGMEDPVAVPPGDSAPTPPTPTARRPGWWIAPAYLVMAALLVPWIVVLARTLPDRVVSANYRLAWVGFDALLAGSLVRTAWLAYRRSPFLVNIASVTAALLVVDAWFDVTTSPRGRELVEAFATAVLVELPLAALSMVLAHRAQLEIARTGAVRRHRWERHRDPVP